MAEARDLLTTLLRDVSRSFYLSLWLLPSAVRRPIALGYLLARATDTIADTTLLPVSRRLAALGTLRGRIQGEIQQVVDLSEWAVDQNADATAGERVLLARVEEAVTVLGTLEASDRGRVRSVLATITSGQELDLQRFDGASRQHVIALPDAASLDDYTHRVAGCVGDFWTRVCRAHLFPDASLDEAALLEDGVRFGKGLQLVNILRDLPRDLAQGRCYLPEDELRAVGLKASDLLEPSNESRLAPVYGRWLERAEGHLSAGWRYTTTLPRSQVRVRLACALPVLIGVADAGGPSQGRRAGSRPADQGQPRRGPGHLVALHRPPALGSWVERAGGLGTDSWLRRGRAGS